jgi:hypothetical protein
MNSSFGMTAVDEFQEDVGAVVPIGPLLDAWIFEVLLPWPSQIEPWTSLLPYDRTSCPHLSWRRRSIVYQIAPRHDAQNDRLPFSGYRVICAHGSRDRTEAVRETRWKSVTRALIVLGCRTYPTHLRRPQDGWRALPAARRRSRLAKACHFCPSSIACAHRRSVSKGTYPRTERSRPQNGDCAHAGGERSTRSPRAILH